MQCLTWAFSKPRGSKQEPYSSTALWSKSWPQQLPPPCQAPLGAAGGAGLPSQSTSACSAMGSSAQGASEGLRQQRLGTAARVERQVDITSHPKSSIAALSACSVPWILLCRSSLGHLPCTGSNKIICGSLVTAIFTPRCHSMD